MDFNISLKGSLLSISAELADYEATWELLSRLSLDELEQLAKHNNIALQKEDAQGNIQKARSKEEAIDILVASEFRESDIVELLGVNRLTKEELLNLMSTRQLKILAKETGVLLEKSTLFGMKKAVKKKDVVKALRVLAVSKVRQHAEKIGLIKKVSKKAKKRKPTKAAMRKPTKKAIKKKRMRKAKVIEPLVKEPFLPMVEHGRIEEKPLQIMVPAQQAQIKSARIIEETIRERLVEREIVRRQFTLGQRQEGSVIKKKETKKIPVEAKRLRRKTENPQ
jgi:hypothetical protein